MATNAAQLISLMDHTPGQRQFRDLDKYFTYYSGNPDVAWPRWRNSSSSVQGRCGAALGKPSAHRRTRQAHGVALASHDDTTLEEVALAHSEGVGIAEFPTTIEAAIASRAVGMATVMGAPNVVRGGSHSGNASARELAEAGQLDILSSDYVPAALLMAAFRLADAPCVGGLRARSGLLARRRPKRPGCMTAAKSRWAAARICCASLCTTANRSCGRCGARGAGCVGAHSLPASPSGRRARQGRGVVGEGIAADSGRRGWRGRGLRSRRSRDRARAGEARLYRDSIGKAPRLPRPSRPSRRGNRAPPHLRSSAAGWRSRTRPPRRRKSGELPERAEYRLFGQIGGDAEPQHGKRAASGRDPPPRAPPSCCRARSHAPRKRHAAARRMPPKRAAGACRVAWRDDRVRKLGGH